ncbi:MAG: serine/threonine protein kinase [Planctomycetes bacterium]|nr:serine/threonine protein kinase [Planctomycetota bacterium]
MKWLSDSAIARLRAVADLPDLRGTRYEIVEPLGRGGMGAVYVAQDRELDRKVALKVLVAAHSGADAALRMRREAHVIAQLEHPGIVPVHDVGTLVDGRIYYAMKLVRGSRLDEHIATPRPLAERLRIFERVCEAVAFAHAHGVIHRDLKPQNVMVGAFGEVLVMDWGLAKVRGDDSPALASMEGGATVPGATEHGTVLGTPGFMAPEQARGDVAHMDERTDVFALGATLRFLVDADAPPPLKAIVRKAMQEEPGDRYASVDVLRADVGRFLAGEPVSAFPESILVRTRRLARKYRTAILLVIAYLVVRALLLAFLGR